MSCKSILLVLVSIFMLTSFDSNGQNKINSEPPNITVRKIWDKAPYNAFTDLLRFNGKFYCTFREGSGHVPGKNGTNGEIRVLVSKTGEKWESVALLKKDGIDLRDPKLSITPKGKLMVICGGSIYKNDSLLGRHPQVSFSNKEGKDFSVPEKVNLGSVGNNYDWIWRVTWHNNTGYGVDYQIGPKDRFHGGGSKIVLVKTKDGKNFNLVHEFHVTDFPNESTIRFNKKGRMYILIRRELGDKMGEIATSIPSYKDWTFHKLSLRLGGPNFIFLNKKQLILGSRIYYKKNNTEIDRLGIMLTNLNGKIDTTIVLPSGGDTGYPGLCLYNDTLLVTYYSNQFNSNSFNSHTSIYMAKIPVSIFKDRIKK